MYIPLSSVSHPFLINLGSFFTSVIGIVDTSFFATIDFFSGTTGVVFNADSVVAFCFAFGTIGGFVSFCFAFCTIGGFVAFGFAFGTIGGFVATALITFSGLGASHFRTSHNVHFTTHLSSNPPSSFIIC